MCLLLAGGSNCVKRLEHGYAVDKYYINAIFTFTFYQNDYKTFNFYQTNTKLDQKGRKRKAMLEFSQIKALCISKCVICCHFVQK